MSKAFYITAAPVGAVPKYLDPQEPKFIPGLLLDHLIPNAKLPEILQLLKREGWESTPAGGWLLQDGYAPAASREDFFTLPEAQQITSLEALQAAGWQLGNGVWRPQAAAGPAPARRLPRTLFKLIPSRALVRQLVQQLTTHGWESEQGDLVWRSERLSSYLPPEMVAEIKTQAPEAASLFLAGGWKASEAGMWQPGKARSPHLPITADRIVAESLHCAREGAAVIHLHTRDLADQVKLAIPGLGAPISAGQQRNQIVLDQYENIVPAMRLSAPATLLNLSTSARGDRSASQSPLRRAHLKNYAGYAAPEIASLSPGPVVFQTGGGYDNPNGFLREQLEHFQQTGVRPEIEVFNHIITENAITLYRQPLQDSGAPVLFMLVAGVDQHRRDPVSGEVEDDSLIDPASRKQIQALLQQEETAAAAKLAAEQLRPTVKQLRQHFRDCRISLLLPGALHAILVDVAIALDLDGIRVGLEDGLNLIDPHVPGGIRKARSAEQVKGLREELEQRGYHVMDADELRRDLRMPRQRLHAEAVESVEA
ncbi:3-keto-5-aminohexanoate cleavage protein [Chromobacterium sp. IIBBL 290-4]|uniref:3-keto-5-aminohexanoate cleavage protein n=1 Tax=Chromobacterium sp. IIBBL 290-4 TaxID=2953890 RepID=UPI0020B8B544|nr:3-keto-5-aminohexanoate cleavage protein [Chromobacterium sp. IIBBL 290-4]UTH72816.1 3-keto-5-aminohexanoate cleavage protein [Chromobacterium sp. IIBBL 290-4]